VDRRRDDLPGETLAGGDVASSGIVNLGRRGR